MKRCLDTYALVEIEKQSPRYQHIINSEFVITSAALGEFYYVLARLKGEKTAEFWTKKLLPFAEDIDKHLWIEAMRFRLLHRDENISVIDALGYAYAKKQKLPFVTGDQSFKGKPGVLFIP